MLTAIAFYLFSAVLIAATLMVIASRNPVHSVLYLILAFFNAAALFVLLGAEFLALILVVVYVGAVAVLFLFVVMMLDIHIERLRQGFWRHFPLALAIGALISLEMALVLFGGFRVDGAPAVPETVTNAAGQVVQYSNTRELGMLMFSQYLFPVEIAAVILLVAMVSAIALTLRQRKDNKAIDASLQVRVHPQDRLQVVQLAPTRPAPPAEAPAPAAATTPEGATS